MLESCLLLIVMVNGVVGGLLCFMLSVYANQVSCSFLWSAKEVVGGTNIVGPADQQWFDLIEQQQPKDKKRTSFIWATLNKWSCNPDLHIRNSLWGGGNRCGISRRINALPLANLHIYPSWPSTRRMNAINLSTNQLSGHFFLLLPSIPLIIALEVCIFVYAVLALSFA